MSASFWKEVTLFQKLVMTGFHALFNYLILIKFDDRGGCGTFCE